jgi:hypothetical protein
MSSIKLTADSGGGTFELKAPSSGSNARVLTVPDSASGTVLTTTNPKSGTIIQTITVTANTALASSSTSYVETPVTGSITPESSSSKIIVTACVPTWPASGIYLQVQLRSSGGNTNNDIGTWGDAYSPSGTNGGAYNSMYRWVHTSHNTTSAITYKIFAKKQSVTGSTWYFPNNNTANSTISWLLTMEEKAA